jgi:hypothetical protein
VDGVCVVANPLYIHFMEFEEDRYFDLVMEALNDSVVNKHIHE